MLVLVELARRKQASRRNQRFMELIDDGGLADTGVSGNEYQLRRATADDTLEGGEQNIDLAGSPVQFLWNHQPVWRVVLARLEFVNAAPSLPFSKAAPKITFNAARGLVPLLGSLGKQLHDDCRDSAGHMPHPHPRRHRLPRNVAVHPFHGIGSREGET